MHAVDGLFGAPWLVVSSGITVASQSPSAATLWACKVWAAEVRHRTILRTILYLAKFFAVGVSESAWVLGLPGSIFWSGCALYQLLYHVPNAVPRDLMKCGCLWPSSSSLRWILANDGALESPG